MDHQNIAVTKMSPSSSVGGALLKSALIDGCSYIQLYFAKAGLMSDGHQHSIHHTLLVAYGAIRLSVDGTVRDIQAGNLVKVIAGHKHDFTALVNGTICYCIVPNITKDQFGELLDDVIVSIPSEAQT